MVIVERGGVPEGEDHAHSGKVDVAKLVAVEVSEVANENLRDEVAATRGTMDSNSHTHTPIHVCTSLYMHTYTNL